MATDVVPLVLAVVAIVLGLAAIVLALVGWWRMRVNIRELRAHVSQMKQSQSSLACNTIGSQYVNTGTLTLTTTVPPVGLHADATSDHGYSTPTSFSNYGGSTSAESLYTYHTGSSQIAVTRSPRAPTFTLTHGGRRVDVYEPSGSTVTTTPGAYRLAQLIKWPQIPSPNGQPSRGDPTRDSDLEETSELEAINLRAIGQQNYSHESSLNNLAPTLIKLKPRRKSQEGVHRVNQQSLQRSTSVPQNILLRTHSMNNTQAVHGAKLNSQTQRIYDANQARMGHDDNQNSQSQEIHGGNQNSQTQPVQSNNRNSQSQGVHVNERGQAQGVYGSNQNNQPIVHNVNHTGQKIPNLTHQNSLPLITSVPRTNQTERLKTGSQPNLEGASSPGAEQMSSPSRSSENVPDASRTSSSQPEVRDLSIEQLPKQNTSDQCHMKNTNTGSIPVSKNREDPPGKNRHEATVERSGSTLKRQGKPPMGYGSGDTVGMSTTKRIGPAGGSISFHGILLEMPPGALSAQYDIKVGLVWGSAYRPPLATQQAQLSPLVVCEPHGLSLLRPCKLRIPHCARNVLNEWNFDVLKSEVGVQDGRVAWTPITLDDYVDRTFKDHCLCLNLLHFSMYTLVGEDNGGRNAAKLVRLMASVAPPSQQGELTVTVACVNDYSKRDTDVAEGALDRTTLCVLGHGRHNVCMTMEKVQSDWTLEGPSSKELAVTDVWHDMCPVATFTCQVKPHGDVTHFQCKIIGYQTSRDHSQIIRIHQRAQMKTSIQQRLADPEASNEPQMFSSRSRRHLARLLDPPSGEGWSDWHALADALFLTWSDVIWVEQQQAQGRSPTLILLQEWREQGRHVQELKAVLIARGRQDAISHIRSASAKGGPPALAVVKTDSQAGAI